jgi:RNA polymerase sigma-70 factor, ECF subfamily
MANNPHPLAEEGPRSTECLPRLNDSVLMARVAAGDQQALMAVYDRYSSLVYALSFQVLQNSESAEDVLQEVFLWLWRNANAYQPARGSLAGWITVMARHQAIDSLRRKVRRKERELQIPIGLIDGRFRNRTESLADGAKIRSILDRLPVEQREVLDLAYFGGFTHSEIASRTGKPIGTVKSRIRLALQSLRRLLNTTSATTHKNDT